MNREEAIKRIRDFYLYHVIEDLPHSHRTVEAFKMAIQALEEPERKKGKWTEKHHSYSDEEYVIEEWQSCRCSECGRYDTRPYMYYFIEPKFCSYCGAKMDGKETANEKD